ncbi:MAG TPA: caspase family protein, partial [Spirochaetia bacterium]|nr:caspase family protein [Spirochaetia bacterium]
MKQRYLKAGAYIVSLFSLLASCTPQLPSPTGYAIVMGIADYPGEENDLTYTVDDAVSVGSLLQAKGYTVSALLIDADATRQDLETQIESIASAIGKEETFILYFSGHGGYSSVLPGEEPEGRTCENECIVLNTEEQTEVDYLTDDELKSLIAEIPAQKKLIL